MTDFLIGVGVWLTVTAFIVAWWVGNQTRIKRNEEQVRRSRRRA